MMTVWKLEPVNPDEHQHDWQASRYVGTVFVRARDEEAARVLALNAFGFSLEVPRDKKIPLQPWNRGQLVTCEHVTESGFEEDGPDEILGPDEALAKAHPSRTGNG